MHVKGCVCFEIMNIDAKTPVLVLAERTTLAFLSGRVGFENDTIAYFLDSVIKGSGFLREKGTNAFYFTIQYVAYQTNSPTCIQDLRQA